MTHDRCFACGNKTKDKERNDVFYTYLDDDGIQVEALAGYICVKCADKLDEMEREHGKDFEIEVNISDEE